jgi:hypothetical protein
MDTKRKKTYSVGPLGRDIRKLSPAEWPDRVDSISYILQIKTEPERGPKFNTSSSQEF